MTFLILLIAGMGIQQISNLRIITRLKACIHFLAGEIKCTCVVGTRKYWNKPCLDKRFLSASS